jgi:tRNA (guanine-N7-)-methyltransferase
VEQFELEGWELREVTNDLHAEGIKGIMTDYEAKFHEMGTPINRVECIVRSKPPVEEPAQEIETEE